MRRLTSLLLVAAAALLLSVPLSNAYAAGKRAEMAQNMQPLDKTLKSLQRMQLQKPAFVPRNELSLDMSVSDLNNLIHCNKPLKPKEVWGENYFVCDGDVQSTLGAYPALHLASVRATFVLGKMVFLNFLTSGKEAVIDNLFSIETMLNMQRYGKPILYTAPVLINGATQSSVYWHLKNGTIVKLAERIEVLDGENSSLTLSWNAPPQPQS